MPSSGVQTCALDRKSTRLNSSHTIISYAVFCLKKKILNRPSRIQMDSITMTPAILWITPAAADDAATARPPRLDEGTRRDDGDEVVFFLVSRHPPISPPFPYPPLSH